MSSQIDIAELKNIVSDCNINFLLGSGVSRPYLSTLGKIEMHLTELSARKEAGEINNIQAKIVTASIYKKYFDGVIAKNINILTNDVLTQGVMNNYNAFLKCVNSILLNRKSSLLNKQVNIFTTNIDIFFEKSLESMNIEYNDGFGGRFTPQYSLSNFKKSLYKTSLHYDNISEIPVFNLMKVHGSLSWVKQPNDKIGFSSDLGLVKDILSIGISDADFVQIDDDDTLDMIVEKAGDKDVNETIESFITKYEKLPIVNPTKEKFKETVLNRNYYELFRIYSNELEKENTVLFVAGFSFADEHIRDVTIRAAIANPTLKILIFSHSSDIDEGIRKIQLETNNNNVQVITPEQTEENDAATDVFSFDLENINNRVFSELLNKIGIK